MRKQMRRLGIVCLLSCLALMAKAQDVTALWDFQNRIPESLSTVAFERNTGYVASTVEGVELYVDATNGKFNAKARETDVQMNKGTIVRIPVRAAGDIVSVTSYPGFHNFTLGGKAAEEDAVEYKALTSDATKGYVEMEATDGCYLYKIQTTLVSKIQEKPIYSTNFSEWKAYETSAKTTVTKATWQTKYSHESLEFSIFNTQIGATNFNTEKFPNWTGGMLMAAKSSNTYIETSALASISKVHFIHGATGSNRGYKLEAKGDGDEEWVVVSNSVANPAAGCDVTVNINKTNCKLRFTNLNPEQNAYLLQLDIYGIVDMSAAPMLGTFKLNGTEYVAADIFTDIDDVTAKGTIHISRNDNPISVNNPLTDVTTDNGDLGEITYNVDGTTTFVTIPVILGEVVKNYELTVDQLPMMKVNYINTDGTKIGTQEIEQYSKIEALVYGENDVTVANGKKFRGWFVSAIGGRKITVDEVVEKNINIYAVATTIESENTKALYLDLRNQYFYAEDHEAFNPIGGSWHDTTHGWAFSKGDKLEILVGGNTDITLGLCSYSEANVNVTVGSEEITAKASSDGTLKTVHYDGAAGKLVIGFNGTTYLHSLTIVNDGVITNGYYVVEQSNADDFLTALTLANTTSGGKGYKIFLPDGMYDLGERTLTQVSASNVSIIGQSMEKTVIKNHPLQEGIGVTATIFNTSSNLYLQDLTLQNALDYYDSSQAGRAVCLQDKGSNTIAKNVRMLSYQDTYYSNSASRFYWEDCVIHGTVDYLCGDGDVVYNRCKFVNESRSATSRSGDCTIAAPYTSASCKWGYVMLDCYITTNSSTFNYGRSWGGNSALAYIRTTIEEPSRLAKNRFTTSGMNVAAYSFKEYGTMNTAGENIAPASNVLTFTHTSGNKTYETILTDEEAAKYTLENIYGTWAPDAKAAQLTMGDIKVETGAISWNAVEGATAYAVFNNGELVAITDATTYNVTDGDADKYSVRAANERGGFGPAAGFAPSAVENVVGNNGEITSTYYYNTQGARVSENYNGIVIKVDTLKDGKRVATKVVK